MDTSVCMGWVEKTQTDFCSQEKLSRDFLRPDNPETDTKDDFKKLVNSLNGAVCYGLPNATKLWQPVGADYAQVLK